MTSGSGRPPCSLLPNPFFGILSRCCFSVPLLAWSAYYCGKILIFAIVCTIELVRKLGHEGVDSRKPLVFATCYVRAMTSRFVPCLIGSGMSLHFRKELTEKMRPLLRAAAAIPPLALRGDYWAPVTLLPYLVDALRHAGPGVQVRIFGFPLCSAAFLCCRIRIVPCFSRVMVQPWHTGSRQRSFHRLSQRFFFLC